MENELLILKAIEKNNNATQREIAKSAGMSLGNVNILIKKLVEKGMIKVEKSNSRTVQYLLTPYGLREKAEATYRYVVSSYRYISKVRENIDRVLEYELSRKQKQVCLFGTRDELYEILKDKITGLRLIHTHFNTKESMKLYFDKEENKEGEIIIAWQPEFAEYLSRENIKHIYLLEKI